MAWVPQQIFTWKYECLHIVGSCDKSPINKTKIKLKGLILFWKYYFKCCSNAHKIILVIIDVSSITIKFVCFNVLMLNLVLWL
jgi:hypothetical protein